MNTGKEALTRLGTRRVAGLPLWLVGVVALVIAGAAGQALGPVLAGDAGAPAAPAGGAGGGNVGLVASQSLFFSAANASVGHSGTDNVDQAAASIDTAGLILQAAFRMHRGDEPSSLDIEIGNRGSGRRGAFINLTRPEKSSVNLFETDGDCQLAQRGLSINTSTKVWTDQYLLTVNTGATCTINARVQVGSAEALGASSLTFTIQEIP